MALSSPRRIWHGLLSSLLSRLGMMQQMSHPLTLQWPPAISEAELQLLLFLQAIGSLCYTTDPAPLTEDEEEAHEGINGFNSAAKGESAF